VSPRGEARRETSTHERYFQDDAKTVRPNKLVRATMKPRKGCHSNFVRALASSCLACSQGQLRAAHRMRHRFVHREVGEAVSRFLAQASRLLLKSLLKSAFSSCGYRCDTRHKGTKAQGTTANTKLQRTNGCPLWRQKKSQCSLRPKSDCLLQIKPWSLLSCVANVFGA
jgi:hypothetical protein